MNNQCETKIKNKYEDMFFALLENEFNEKFYKSKLKLKQWKDLHCKSSLMLFNDG